MSDTDDVYKLVIENLFLRTNTITRQDLKDLMNGSGIVPDEALETENDIVILFILQAYIALSLMTYKSTFNYLFGRDNG